MADDVLSLDEGHRSPEARTGERISVKHRAAVCVCVCVCVCLSLSHLVADDVLSLEEGHQVASCHGRGTHVLPTVEHYGMVKYG